MVLQKNSENEMDICVFHAGTTIPLGACITEDKNHNFRVIFQNKVCPFSELLILPHATSQRMDILYFEILRENCVVGTLHLEFFKYLFVFASNFHHFIKNLDILAASTY